MSQTAFILPAGLSLRQEPQGLVVEYDGDIELHASPGGRIARLHSRAGDVILRAAMEIGRIEAGGRVVASADLQSEHVAAREVEVGGALKAGTLALRGGLRCEGALQADTVRAATVQCASLRAQEAEVSGDIETSGDARLGRTRAAALRCGGELEADELTLSGELTTLGGARVGALGAGQVSVGARLGGGHVETTGDLRVGGPVELNGLQVGGRAEAEGEIKVDQLMAGGGLSAPRVEVGEGRVDAGEVSVRVITGSRSVHLGAVVVRSDIVLAPVVSLDPQASGRISVVESGTDPGTSRVKGCLSLEDLEDLFGNSAQFLAERGLSAPGFGPRGPAVTPPPAPAPRTTPAPDVEVEVEDPGESMLGSLSPILPQVQAAEGEDRTLDEMLEPEHDEATNGLATKSDLNSMIELSPLSDPDPLEPGAAAVRVGLPTNTGPEIKVEGDDDLFGWAEQMLTEVVAADAVQTEEQDLDIPTGGVEPVLEPEPEPELVPEPEPVEDPIHGQIHATVSRIVTCYAHTEMPPAVTRLRDLVEARDYGRVRSDITEIWNQLLKFHQKRGMRIQPQVTTTFNTINSLVRKL